MIKVSVIITTKNEERHIENCLRAVKAQNFSQGDIEIIVVDNKSTDRTKEISLKYTNNVFDFGPERSAQRNFGVDKAKGKYILYLDADMIISADVIDQCVQKCETAGTAGLYISEKIVNASAADQGMSSFTLEKQSFWIKVRNFERSFYDGTVIDCVRFVKRDIFLAVKGFDENLTGPEDWDFDRKIRAKGEVSLISSVLYHNEGGFALGKYLNKKRYYSNTFGKYMDKWGKDDAVVKKQLGFFYRFIGVFIESGKWTRLMSHPLLTLSMYFLRFLVGFNYLITRRRH